MTRKAAQYTVTKGTRYKATLRLNSFEALASNNVIALKLTRYGFAKVVVTGEGREREALATWDSEDATAEMPKQVASVTPA